MSALNNNKLVDWLKTEKFFKSRKDDTREDLPTHSLFSGGVAYVPTSANAMFYKLYAEEVTRGTKLFFTERITNESTFRLIMDLDISGERYLLTDDMHVVVKAVQDVVKRFYKESNHYVVCCVAGPKTKGDLHFTGCHLRWPDILCVTETALLIASAVTTKLQLLAKEHASLGIVDIEADSAVYNGSGLRMLYSDKTKKVNGLREPEGRQVKPVFTMDINGKLRDVYMKNMLANMAVLIRETSIRCIDGYMATPYVVPEDLVAESVRINADVIRKAERRGVAKAFNSGTLKTVIQAIIRDNFEMQYTAVVQDIKQFDDGGYVVRTNSTYCENVGRCHGSSTVYFYISKWGICQKCFCRKGSCERYSSGYVQFNQDQLDILFPGDNASVAPTDGTSTGSACMFSPDGDDVLIVSEKVSGKVSEKTTAGVGGAKSASVAGKTGVNRTRANEVCVNDVCVANNCTFGERQNAYLTSGTVKSVEVEEGDLVRKPAVRITRRSTRLTSDQLHSMVMNTL